MDEKNRIDVDDDGVAEQICKVMSVMNKGLTKDCIRRNPHSKRYEGIYKNKYGETCSICVGTAQLKSYFHSPFLWMKKGGGIYYYKVKKS